MKRILSTLLLCMITKTTFAASTDPEGNFIDQQTGIFHIVQAEPDPVYSNMLHEIIAAANTEPAITPKIAAGCFSNLLQQCSPFLWLIIQETSSTDPHFAEMFFWKYFPKYQPIKRAALLTAIACGYEAEKDIPKTMECYAASMLEYENSCAALSLYSLHRLNGNNEAAAYWFGKTKELGFKMDDIQLQSIKPVYAALVKQGKKNFKQTVQKILLFEQQGQYNPFTIPSSLISTNKRKWTWVTEQPSLQMNPERTEQRVIKKQRK